MRLFRRLAACGILSALAFCESFSQAIPDSWQLQYLGNLSYSASADPGNVGRTLLQSYQQGLSPWPAPILSSGLRAWYRADLGIIKDSGNDVTQWTDLSGTGATITQANSAMYPLWSPTAINGLPAVQFNGSSSNLVTPGLVDLFNGGTDASVFVVFNPAAPQETNGEILDGSNVSFRLYQYGDVTNQYALLWMDPSGDIFTSQGTDAVTGVAQVIDVVKNGTTVNGYMNGTLQSTGTFGWASSSDFSSGPVTWTLGGKPTAYFGGQIAEVLFYNRALTDTEREQIESSLVSKYVPTDSNGNGIPDTWEMQYLGNLNDVATADPGGVGRTLLQSYQQGLSPWPAPIVSSGLKAWYRADLGLVKDSTGKVSQWTDLSGTGASVAQNDATQLPQYVGTAMNGHPALQFNGSTTNLDTPGTVDLFQGANDATVIVVVNPATTQPTSGTIFDGANAALKICQNNTVTNQYMLFWLGADSSGYTSGYINAVTGVPQVMDFVKNGNGLNNYLNGSLQNSSSITWNPTPNLQQGARTWAIGGQQTAYFNGQIAEVLVYNRALSDSERQSIETSLTAKYVNPDVNGNGIPDSWETQYLGNLGYAASADPGGVGRTLLQSYQQGLSPWPAALVGSGLTAWYRADLGLVADSINNVSQWTDLSGTGATLIQNDTTRFPQLVSSAMNGHPALAFNGSTTDLVTPGPVDLTQGSNDTTIIAVINPAGTQPTNSVLLDGYNAALRLCQNDVVTNQFQLLWIGTDANVYNGAVDNATAGAPQIIDIMKSGSTLTSYLDGALQNTTSIWWNSAPNLQQGARSWTLGAMSNQLANFNGQVSEMLIYNRALTTTERQAVEAALTAKYLVTAPAITSSPTSTGSSGSSFTYQITANGSPTSYNANGLPPGLAINTSTGAITGTAAAPGIFSVTVSATNASGTSSIALTLTITAPLPSGEILWLRADAGVSTDSNGNVSTWQDQSGHGNNATQSGSSARPSLATNALNGLPVLQFNAASSQWLTLPSNLMGSATSGEAFIVLKASSALPSAGRGLWYLGTEFGYYPYLDGSVYENFGTTTQYKVGVPPSGITNYSVYNVSAQSGQFAARMDAVTLTSNTTNQVSFTSSPTLGINANNQPFDGEIAELIIFGNELTPTQRATVGQYLTTKYNLPGIVAPSNPGSLSATPVSSTETDLVWSDAPTTTGITYTIWRQSGSDDFVAIKQIDNALSFLDSGLIAATSYNYRVSSSTLAGSSPGFSNVANATTLANGADMPLTGMNLWLKADTGVQATSGGSISEWLDLSGNGNNALQQPVLNTTTTVNQPTLAAGALNGLPVVAFAGASNQFFSLPSASMGNSSSGEAFVVVKATSASPSVGRALWHLGSNGGEYPYSDQNIYESFGSTVQYKVGTPASGITNYSLYNVVAGPGQFSAQIDGVTLFSNTTNQVFFATNPLIGTNGTDAFDGQVAELIVYNGVLTAAQRSAVGRYLEGKYKLQGEATPSNPTNLAVAAVSGTEASLTWADASTATGITYTVWRESGSGGFVAIKQIDNALSYVDSGLTDGTSYTYEVSSSTLAGSSPGFSNTASMTTLAGGTDMPLTGMALWLKADTGVQAAPSGGISEWLDQSGNGNNAVQEPIANVVTVANQPTLARSVINGNPVVQFTAANNQYFSLPATLMNGATEGEAFVVVNATSTFPAAAHALWHLGSNGGEYPYIDGNIYESFGSTVQYKVGIPDSNVTNYIAYNVSARAGQFLVQADGVTLFSTASNQVSFATNPLLGTNGSDPFDGQIAEVIVYAAALTAPQRATVDQYLETKYNLVTAVNAGTTDGISNSWLLQFFGSTDVNPGLDFIGNGQTVAQDFLNSVNPVDYYNGRAFAVVSSGMGNTYSYDLSGRLNKASYSNGVNVQFTNDAASNVAVVANYGPIVQWRIANSLPSDGTGIGADAAVVANDGIPNLVKYALGLTAGTPGPANSPLVTLSNIDGGYVTLAYTRPDPAPSDIIYNVRVSSDGVNWSSGSGATVNVSTSISNGLATVVVRDNVAVTLPILGRHIQLTVQRIPQP